MSGGIYKSATIKLTVWYVLIVVAISLSFSAVVYHFAVTELAHGLRSQSQRIYQAFPVFDHDPFFRRDSDLAAGEHHILLQLAEFNLMVLVGAGFASYWLARRTLRPIEESNDRQKRFTADASHELRTPLTAIKMSSEVALLDTTASKSELQAALQSNVEEADKLDRLINNLLRLSKLEAGVVQDSFSELDMTAIVTAALDDVQAQAISKRIKLKHYLATAKVMGDGDSLKQMLVILLDNAIKYSPPDSTVTITVEQQGDHIHLTVSDHGTGIEPSALRHVFDRFYRADEARQSENGNGGYGLGLSIAKHIADLHNARLTITSTRGEGTTATINLPAAQPPKS